MEQHNRAYQSTTSTELLLTDYYEPAEVSRQTLMTATEILSDLQQRLKGPDRPTMRQLTQALKAQGFRYGAQQGRHGWYVRSVTYER